MSHPRVPPGVVGWLFLLAGLAANIIYLGVARHPPNAGSLSAGLRTQGNGLGSLFVTGLLARAPYSLTSAAPLCDSSLPVSSHGPLAPGPQTKHKALARCGLPTTASSASQRRRAAAA